MHPAVLALIRVAAGLQDFCEARDRRFRFIGGLALQRWGEPRETIDVDATLLTGFGDEEPFIAALLDRYAGRIDDAAGFARTNRVLRLRSVSSVGIDIALGRLPFEESVVREPPRPDRLAPTEDCRRDMPRPRALPSGAVSRSRRL